MFPLRLCPRFPSLRTAVRRGQVVDFWLKAENCSPPTPRAFSPKRPAYFPSSSRPPNVTGCSPMGHVLNNTIPGNPRPQGAHGRQGKSSGCPGHRTTPASATQTRSSKKNAQESRRKSGIAMNLGRGKNSSNASGNGRKKRAASSSSSSKKLRRFVRRTRETVHEDPEYFALCAEGVCGALTKRASSIAANAW